MVFLEVVLWTSVFVLLFLFGAVAFLWEWQGFRVYWMTKDIPGLSKVPLIGDAVVFASLALEDIFGFLEKKTENCRFIKAELLGISTVMLLDPDDIEKLLGSSVNLKKGFEYFPMKPWLREGLLVSDGNKWRQRRKLLTPTFHFKILEDNVGQVASYSSKFVQKLLETQGKPVDPDDLVRKYTLDVICETAMGVKMDAMENGKLPFVEATKRASEVVVKRSMELWLKDDAIFYITGTGKRFKKDLDILHSFTEQVIENRKEERKFHQIDGKEAGRRKAFLDILLEANETIQGSLTSLDIREEVDTFMFEGHDTTSTAIVHALHELGNNPDVQEQAFEEQKRIFGMEKREPTMQDLKEMAYLEMVIKEVLRLYPSVPYISRKLTEDLILGDGRILPTGVNASVMPYLVHRKSNIWDEPDKFCPDRFLPGINRHPYSYIPFSAGPRNCIGMKFAMLEMKATLSNVIRNCRIEAESKKLRLLPQVILKSSIPVIIRVYPRE